MLGVWSLRCVARCKTKLKGACELRKTYQSHCVPVPLRMYQSHKIKDVCCYLAKESTLGQQPVVNNRHLLRLYSVAACKISEQKDVRTRFQTIFPDPITHLLSML